MHSFLFYAVLFSAQTNMQLQVWFIILSLLQNIKMLENQGKWQTCPQKCTNLLNIIKWNQLKNVRKENILYYTYSCATINTAGFTCSQMKRWTSEGLEHSCRKKENQTYPTYLVSNSYSTNWKAVALHHDDIPTLWKQQNRNSRVQAGVLYLQEEVILQDSLHRNH